MRTLFRLSLTRWLVVGCLLLGLLPAALTSTPAWASSGQTILAAQDQPIASSSDAILSEIEAPAVVVMDMLTGTVLLEQEADVARFPASLTKIMTLLLVMDALDDGRINLEDEVTVSPAAAGWGGTQIFLAAGEVMSVADLLKAVAIASANDASTALAEHIAGSTAAFVADMNAEAQRLGLNNTNFDNPHGIDTGLELADHHMSARDVALASRALMLRHPEILELTGIYIDEVRDPAAGQCCELVNTNRLVRFHQDVDGLKTGHTSRANFGIAATAQRDGGRFLVVLMGHPHRPSRDAEAVRLLDWAFSRWEPVPLVSAGETVRRLPVEKGQQTEVDIITEADFGVLVPRGEKDSLEQTITVQHQLTAPVEPGQKVGRLTVSRAGETLGEVDLVAAQDVPRLQWPGLLIRLLQHNWPFH